MDSLHGTNNKSSSQGKKSISQNNLIDENNSSEFIKDVRTGVKGAFVLLPLLGIPWIL